MRTVTGTPPSKEINSNVSYITNTMTPEKIAEQEAATAAAKKAADDKALADAAAASHSDPVKEALEREKNGTKTKVEKAAFSLKKNAESLRALGGDPAAVLGIPVTAVPADAEEDEDDSKPVTRGDLRKMRMQESQQTAMQLADSVENPDERELAKVYLQTRIRPSGDPQKDLEDALALVNSVKNSQVSQEITRKAVTQVRRTSSGSGSAARETTVFEATPDELAAAKLGRVKPEDLESWVTNARIGKPVVFGSAAKRMKESQSKSR